MTRVRMVPLIALLAFAAFVSGWPVEGRSACCGRWRPLQRVRDRAAARRAEPSSEVASRCVGDACQVVADTAPTLALPPPPR